ncbi:SMI1/KNR4 family protein [uncultured Pseudomonas sp.]|uniref:SMI1/KNR4 family protein n=1 Tax=uncultured Pseudomonas sp. TaxID=114707 RepID=UPI0025FBCAB5|nr:SMI1/KNR4 family protein [uncultured Pseudomonas sp.]
MNPLKALVERHQADTLPATTSSIEALEGTLGFALSREYKDYLSTFGVIVYDAYETYGLGVKADSYLNVQVAHADLSRDPAYPKNCVPVLELGDGQYYLYDNASGKVVLWATPNGGIVRVLEEGLEGFLIKYIFEAS